MRVGLSSEDLRSICRPSSSGPAFKAAETQVDDSSEQQKAQQDRKKEKRRLKKKLLKEEKKRRKEEAKQGETIDLPPSLDSGEVNIGNTQHPSSITATMSSQSVVDEAPPSYNGLSGIPLETSSADTSSSHTVRPSSQKAEEPEEQNESSVHPGGLVAALITREIAVIVSFPLGLPILTNMPQGYHKMAIDKPQSKRLRKGM
ncbi:hypothetical protein APSETT444_009433 [Aspergillus pseudonomiae]